MKPLIVWDYDDVLYPMMEAWFIAAGRKIQSHVDHFKHISENPPHNLMEINLSKYYESLDRFRNSEQALAIAPKNEITNWFRQNGGRYRHFVLTARPLHTLESAQKWLNNFFPGVFEGFGFVPSQRPGHDLSQYHRSKREYLEKEELSCTYFVDDKVSTVNDVAEIQGVTAITYPQPWNHAWENKASINELLPRDEQ